MASVGWLPGLRRAHAGIARYFRGHAGGFPRPIRKCAARYHVGARNLSAGDDRRGETLGLAPRRFLGARRGPRIQPAPHRPWARHSCSIGGGATFATAGNSAGFPGGRISETLCARAEHRVHRIPPASWPAHCVDRAGCAAPVFPDLVVDRDGRCPACAVAGSRSRATRLRAAARPAGLFASVLPALPSRTAVSS